MEPKKFENDIKKVLQKREIKPSAEAWEQLEQRLQREKGTAKTHFWWVSGVAATAIVFFLLGSYFTSPITSETPQIVKETPETQVLQDKTAEPEVLPVATSEEEEIQEETSVETTSKNAIFEAPVSEASKEEIAVASQDPSEEIIAIEEEASVERISLNDIKTDIAAQNFSTEVSDHEIEALLLLATAELEANPAYTVSADDLLHEVEFELDRSFRQKVFEVVKDKLLKAKTAVANRDF